MIRGLRTKTWVGRVADSGAEVLRDSRTSSTLMSVAPVNQIAPASASARLISAKAKSPMQVTTARPVL